MLPSSPVPSYGIAEQGTVGQADRQGNTRKCKRRTLLVTCQGSKSKLLKAHCFKRVGVWAWHSAPNSLMPDDGWWAMTMRDERRETDSSGLLHSFPLLSHSARTTPSVVFTVALPPSLPVSQRKSNEMKWRVSIGEKGAIKSGQLMSWNKWASLNWVDEQMDVLARERTLKIVRWWK